MNAATAADAYKAMIVAGDAGDVVFTAAVNGHPASWLAASLRDAGLNPARLSVPGGRGDSHLPAGVKPWRDVWSAGQGIGLIHDIPWVAELVERLRAEALAMGLIDLLAGEGRLDNTFGVFVGEVLANSRLTNPATKRLMNETDGMSLADGLAHAHRHHPGTAPDHGDRLARFGRAPRTP